MDISREERKELDALSKEIFGVSSRWQKILNKGVSTLATRTVTEIVPGENGAPDTTKEVQVPLLTESGQQYKHQKYYTVAELKELLLDLKRQRDEYIKKLVDQKEQEALQAKVQEAAGTKPIG